MGRRLLWVFVLLFCVSEFAFADLVRRGGRGSISVSDATDWFYVSDSNINALGLDANFTPLDSWSLQTGRWQAGAAPEECYNVFDFDDPSYTDEPCYWQFIQGQQLVLQGFTGVLLDAVSVLVNWRISGNGISENFSGEIQDTNTFLDVMMPDSLIPGEYTVSMEVTFLSGDGFSYFVNTDIHSSGPNLCGELIPGDPNSFTCAYDYRREDTLSFSMSERLVILSRPIPEPMSLGLIGFALLLWRRRKSSRL